MTLPIPPRGAAGVLLLLLAGLLGLGGAEARPGRVQFSDGSKLVGTISPAPGATFRCHDGRTLHTLAFAQLQELNLLPEKEEVRRHFRMPEAGKAVKEEFGEPYGVRELSAVLVLTSGEVVRGHLYATALVVETRPPSLDPAGDPGERRKVLLPAKQQGAEGEPLLALSYPARITFGDASPAARAARIAVHLADGPADEVAAVARDSLAVLSVETGADPQRFAIVAPLDTPCFLALRRGATLRAGWPANDAALLARMAPALAGSTDFFDDKRLLAAWRPAGGHAIYTLALLYRQAPTTDGPARPWHLELLRWTTNDEDRLMLAARGTLLRGLADNAAALPTVELSSGLWNAAVQDGTLELRP